MTEAKEPQVVSEKWCLTCDGMDWECPRCGGPGLTERLGSIRLHLMEIRAQARFEQEQPSALHMTCLFMIEKSAEGALRKIDTVHPPNASPAAVSEAKEQVASEMVEVLQALAAYAPDDDMLMPDRFAPEPPTWATWEDMGMYGETCGRCNSWCEVVRPGKTQCPTCGDNDLTALAIRARAALSGSSVGHQTSRCAPVLSSAAVSDAANAERLLEPTLGPEAQT